MAIAEPTRAERERLGRRVRAYADLYEAFYDAAVELARAYTITAEDGRFRRNDNTSRTMIAELEERFDKARSALLRSLPCTS